MGQLQWWSRNRESLCFVWHQNYCWELGSDFLDSQRREIGLILFLLASPHLVGYAVMVHGQYRGSNSPCEHHRTARQMFLLLAHLQQASPTPCTRGSSATVLLALPLITILAALSIVASMASSLSLFSVRQHDIFLAGFGGCPCSTFLRQHHRSSCLEGASRGQTFSSSSCWGQLQAYLHHTNICASEWTYLRCLKGFCNFCKQTYTFSVNDWSKSVLMQNKPVSAQPIPCDPGTQSVTVFPVAVVAYLLSFAFSASYFQTKQTKFSQLFHISLIFWLFNRRSQTSLQA